MNRGNISGHGIVRCMAAILVAGSCAAAAPAQKVDDALFTQERKHEHGVSTLDIAVEGSAIALSFEAPAIDLLGFEHPPRNAAELAKFREIGSLLAKAESVVRLPAEAGCKLTKMNVAAPGWPDAIAATATGHEEVHEHEDGHDGAEATGEHADYDASYEFSCTSPAKLTYLDVLLRRQLQAATRMKVNLVSATRQSSQELTDGQSRITLR